MNKKYKELIAQEYKNCVNNTIMRLQAEPTYRPFHSALLSEEAIFWSRFERSFSTSFGQRVIEEIARLVALSNGATEAMRQKNTYIELDATYCNAVTDHIHKLRGGATEVLNCDLVIENILKLPKSGTVTNLRVISDLWWKKDGIDNYISLKTVKPNIDQTSVAKEDCLHLKLADSKCRAYFGLPYNPYGERAEDYAFNPPMGIFDFRHDPVVLIGKTMWDTIGGEGCYEEILRIAKKVGEETKETISKKFK